MKKTDKKTESAVINEYLNNKNMPELAIMFNLGTTTIHRILKRNSIETRGVSEAQRDKNIIHNFYSRFDERSCYWAGFFAADGCVCKNNGTYVVSLTQHLDDINHLRKYATTINFKKEISTGINETSYGITEWARIIFASKEMFNDLKNNFNIIEKKSLVLKPPLLRNEYISSFIRGYFDGDGHILERKYWTIGFTGTFEMLEWIKEKIRKGCEAGNPSIIKEKNEDKNTYSLRFTGKKQAPRIISWMYESSTYDIRMNRKYKIALDYLKQT